MRWVTILRLWPAKREYSARGYGCVSAVAPLAPGAVVALDPWIAQKFCHEIGQARAMMSLAVGDNMFVRGQAALLQHGLDLGQR